MTTSAKTSDFLCSVNHMFDRAVAALALPAGLSEQIRACNSVIKVQFPVFLRGEYKLFSDWRAVHSEHRLPVRLEFPILSLHPGLRPRGVASGRDACRRASIPADQRTMRGLVAGAVGGSDLAHCRGKASKRVWDHSLDAARIPRGRRLRVWPGV